jgi:hypothetical protein
LTSPPSGEPSTRRLRPPRRTAILAARIIAIVADLLQLVFLPLFAEGVASPINDALDVVVGAIMIWLLGWHMAFLPAFLVEILPFGDLAPSWILAVFLVTRPKVASANRRPLFPREE